MQQLTLVRTGWMSFRFYNAFKRKGLFYTLIGILFLFSQRSLAAISVTAATGGTNICYTTAANGSGPAYTTIGSIVLTEGGLSDFGNTGTGTITIAPPPGWQFNTSVLPTVTGGGGNITVSRAWSGGSLVVTRTMSLLSLAATNSVTITGLQVQATTTSSASGSITNSAQTGTWTGLSTGTNLGNLSLQGAPAAISGATSVCVNATTALTDASGTSTWTSSNTSIATIGATTGIVTGIAAGTVNITFTPSCGFITRVMSVNALPTVTGTGTVCVGSITNLSGSPAGTWLSSNTTIAVVSSSGQVSGISANTAIITFTATSTTCKRNTTVTVNPLPSAITGTASACIGGITTLSSATGPGTWTNGGGSAATVNAVSGAVTGVAAGFEMITYTLSTNCKTSREVTINPLPVITVSPSSSATICDGQNASFTASATGPTPGYNWSGAAGLSCAACAATTITPTAVGNNSYSVTATDANGCSNVSSVTVSVNPMPVAITGSFEVCVNSLTTLLNTSSGGTWTSSNSTIATINASTGEVRGEAPGNATITYSLAGGCYVVKTITVNPLPQDILGATEVCSGASITLNDLSGGGDWTSSMPAVAPIDAAGIINGGIAGTSIISYTFPATGCYVTTLVTVHSLPGAIGGVSELCEGSATTLTNAGGGTWSSDDHAVADIDALSGELTANDAGTSAITYTLPTGCYSSKIFTVNQMPSTIGGTLEVCEGLLVALDNSVAGGTWDAATPTTASIDVDGVVTGVDAGNSIVSYTLPEGCFVTAEVTVHPTPATIDGDREVCEGLMTTLSNVDPGGTWESSSFSTAVVDGTGIVTGFFAGECTITYTLPTGCINTADVTVNPLPAVIVGNNEVCEGLTTTLTNSTAGGGWSSSNHTAATIDVDGVVSAHDAGNTVITYTLSSTGCLKTIDMTVNPLPAAIVGVGEVCEASTLSLTDATTGGTWISGNTIAADVDASGVVSGIAAGTATITYKLPTTCQVVADVTVNPLPAPIIGTKVVCEFMTTTLANITPDGTWTSGGGNASVVAGTGVVTGELAGNETIAYTLPTGCSVNTEVTVNPVPANITGARDVCFGLTTSLGSTSGGTWTSSAPLVATVNASSGIVTGINPGNTNITYTLPTSCRTMASITVNPLPAPIAGSGQICKGATGTMTDGSPGGTWSSSNASIASIDEATGEVTANDAGSSLITYALATGCLRTRAIIVNGLPAAIAGAMQVCQSRTTTLSNSVAGGSWISGAPSVATVSSAGVVAGVAAGTVEIAYRLPTGCETTAVVTVDVMPSILTSGAVVCQGETVILPTSLPGGSWTSGAGTIASVDGAGAVTGVGVGSAYISYIMPTGCTAAIAIVVNEMPSAIAGPATVCQGGNATLTNPSTAGVWTSLVTSVASINLSTGVVTGLAAGTTNIRYTMLAGGCFVTQTITVDPLPAAFTGTPVVCNGQTTALSSTSPGGTWTSGNAAVATVGTSGIVSGATAGTSAITYALPTGCARSTIVTVNALPTVYNVTGGGTYCAGGTGVHVGLDNSHGGSVYQLYSGSTPMGSAVTGATGMPVDFGYIAGVGSYSVVATSATTGCNSNMSGIASVWISSSVPASVSFISASGSDTVCSGTPLTFTATAVNGGTTPAYHWQVNGITMPGAVSNAFTYTPSHGDVVTVNMESSTFCATPAIATDNRTVTVNASVMPVANITTTAGASLCAGTPATFNASAVNGGSAPIFSWFKNGAFQSTGVTYTYTPVHGDIVYMKLESNHDCRLADEVSSSIVTMTVNPVYNPVVNVTADPGTTVQVGTDVTVAANVINAGPSPEYQWYVGSTMISGATNATYSSSMFSNGDSVSCTVKGTGACGFPGHSYVIMHVGDLNVAIPAANSDIRLMPNPNKGEFAVRGTLPAATDKEVALEVTNMLGQVVYRASIMARNGKLDAQIELDNTLANGMYMLNVISGNERKAFHFVLEQ